MKSEPIQNLLRELVWRRKLTEAEHAGLREQPETQADLELESRLTEGLARLPDAAVPSNFTARVLQAVEREDGAASPTDGLAMELARAGAPAGGGGGGHGHRRSDLSASRIQSARPARQNVALLARTQPMPSVEALKNFDAIQRMSQPHADEKLLALLQ